MRQGESDLASNELLNVRALDSNRDIISVDFRVVSLRSTDTGGDNLSIDDVNAGEAGAVTASELSVHLLNSTNEGNIAVLLVHIVGTRAGVVANSDTVVLDNVLVGFTDLIHGKNLTSGLLKLVHLVEKIPEGL